MRKVFLAQAKDGKLDWGSFNNEMILRQSLKEAEGKTWRLELPETVRSDQQNRFYWFYLEIIERETGNASNDLHEYFKRLLLPPKWLKVMGKDIKVPSSTTKLSKADMGDYMDKICAETGVPIPDPEAAGFTGYKYR